MTQAISASLNYQFRVPNASKTDWSPLVSGPAVELLVFSYQGNVLVDATTTGADGGFTINIPSPPSGSDVVAFIPIKGNGDGGVGFLVADPGFSQAGQQAIGTLGAAKPWLWALTSNTIASGLTYTVTEAQGSGAIHAFGTIRQSESTARQLTGTKGLELVAWVGLGTSWDCGVCFADYPATLANIPFRSQMWIPGDSNLRFYADAVTAHEMGHWFMASYGSSPDEGGKHTIGIPTFPGQAWSEGFATWHSSVVRGSPFYIDKQGGGMFYADLSARMYGNGTPWTRPSVTGGLLQRMDENELAAMMLGLGATPTAAQPIVDAFRGIQMNTSPWGRGYTRKLWTLDAMNQPINVVDTGIPKPTFPDMLDALNCRAFSRSAIDVVTQPTVFFPYPSSQPICLGGPCAGCRDNMGACQPGTVTGACGSGGINCTVCSGSQSCVAGTCQNPSCNSSNCSGCCSGTTCVTTQMATGCGTGGVACIGCAPGQVCSAGVCKLGEGAPCSSNPSCSSGLCVLNFGSATQGKCRVGCATASPACSAPTTCMPFSMPAGQGACIPPPVASSTWRIFFGSASIKNSTPGGGAWDTFAGGPDPYACASAPNFSAVCTPYIDSTYAPNWNATTASAYSYSDLSAVTFSIYDDDSPLNPDFVDSYLIDLRCPWEGFPCAGTFSHASISTAGSNSLTIGAVPQ